MYRLKNGLIVVFLALVVVLAGIFVFQGKKDKDETANDQSSLETPSLDNNVDEAVEENVNLREIVIEASEFSFSPGSIKAKAGEKITLTLKNTGNMPHDLVFADLEAATKIVESGGTETIEFVVEEAGEYTFYCDISNHRSLGMEGVLIIE